MITITPSPTPPPVGRVNPLLRVAESEQRATTEPVLLIHGTFANKQSDEGVNWWQPGSEFCNNLDALFLKEGVAARCWAGIRNTFAWTGQNSELARRSAGRALAAQLTVLEKDKGTARYHIIGHSHGGNVILNALRELPDKPAKLGAVVFMGAPILSFRHRELNDTRWIAIPLYLIALIGIWQLLPSWNDNSLYFIIPVMITIGLALLAELLRWGSPAARQQDQGCSTLFTESS